MPRGGNRRGIAAPLDMVIFESDEYALPGWDILSPHKDRFGHSNNVKNTSRDLILRDYGIVMTWMQSGVGWLIGNFI
jgi:hypothetical protein